MNIIFDRAVADSLGEKYLVLQLETLEADGKLVECFCVVPGERLMPVEMPVLNHYKRLHTQMIQELADKNYTYCREAIGHLYGKFGGELDSFYQVVLDRIRV